MSCTPPTEPVATSSDGGSGAPVAMGRIGGRSSV